MVQYKLNYFNLRGRGEIIRFIFHAAGQKYEDNRVEFKDWPALKPSSPLGQMPYLEIHNGEKVTKIGQSMAIARHLAREFKLAGSNELEQTIADVYAELGVDLLNDFVKSIFEKDETLKKQYTEKLYNETLGNILSKFETQLTNNNGHLAGSGLTYADLFLSVVLENLGDKKADVLAKYPHVQKLDDKVRTHEKIKAYLDKRPNTNA